MKQKVKVIVAFLLVAMLALSAFGCNGGPDQDGVINEGDVVEVKGKVKLNYYMAQTDGEKRSVNEWVAAFQKNYPDVDVEVETTYLTDKSRIDSQISSGTVGDVFFLTDVELYNYAVVQDVLMPLNYYVEEYNIDLSNVFSAIYEMGCVEGKTYMAMRDYNHMVLFYNKTAVAEANLTDPVELDKNGEWDWDTFKEYCDKLTIDKDGDQIDDQLGAYLSLGYGPIYVSFLEGNGGKWYDTTEKKITFVNESDEGDSPVLQGIQDMISFVEEGTVKYNTRSAATGVEHRAVTGTYAHDQFNDASTSIVFRDIQYPLLNSLAKMYDAENIDWDLVSFPAYGSTPKVGTGAAGFGVFKRTKNPHAAAALCLSLYTEDGQYAYHSQEGGSVPNVKTMAEDTFWRTGVASDERVDEENGKYFDAFISYPERDTYGQPQCVLPPDIATIVDEYMANLIPDEINNTKDWEVTVAELQETANNTWKTLTK